MRHVDGQKMTEKEIRAELETCNAVSEDRNQNIVSSVVKKGSEELWEVDRVTVCIDSLVC